MRKKNSTNFEPSYLLYRSYSDESPPNQLDSRLETHSCKSTMPPQYFNNGSIYSRDNHQTLKEILKHNQQFRKRFDENNFLNSSSVDYSSNGKTSIVSKFTRLFHKSGRRHHRKCYNISDCDDTCVSCDESTFRSNGRLNGSVCEISSSKLMDNNICTNEKFQNNMYKCCKTFISDYERKQNDKLSVSEQSTQANLAPKPETDNMPNLQNNNFVVYPNNTLNNNTSSNHACLHIKDRSANNRSASNKQRSTASDEKKTHKKKSQIKLENSVDGIDISFSKACCLSLTMMNIDGSIIYDKRSLAIPNKSCRVRLQIESTIWHCAAKRIISNGPSTVLESYEDSTFLDLINMNYSQGKKMNDNSKSLDSVTEEITELSEEKSRENKMKTTKSRSGDDIMMMKEQPKDEESKK